MTPKRSWQLLVALALAIALGTASYAFADSKELKQLEKDFAKAISGEDEAGAITAIEAISAIGGEDAIELLYNIGLQHATTPKLYETALKNIGKMDGILAFLTERYGKIDNKGDFRERVFVVDIVAAVPGPEALTQLATYLEDESAFVQGAAVDHLAKSMTNPAIGPLIDLLEKLSKKRKDVLYHQVRDALWVLTGQDFDIIDDWKNWWGPNQGTFDPKASNHEGKTGVERKRRGDDDPEFWGVPVESKQIAFIIDTSGTMRFVQKDDIPGLGMVSGGSDKGGAQAKENQIKPGSPEEKLAIFWSRLEMAKRELARVVKKLDKDALYRIVRFDTSVVSETKSAKPATPANKKSSLEWIEVIKFQGNTATLDALIEGFADPRTNTIYFLSDGRPSKDGNIDDPTRPILDKVFELNRFRKIKIHTFGFDPARMTAGMEPSGDLVEANKWLKELAEATGGKFTLMKVDPRRTPENPDGDLTLP